MTPRECSAIGGCGLVAVDGSEFCRRHGQRCATCGSPRGNHPKRHPFEVEPRSPGHQPEPEEDRPRDPPLQPFTASQVVEIFQSCPTEDQLTRLLLTVHTWAVERLRRQGETSRCGFCTRDESPDCPLVRSSYGSVAICARCALATGAHAVESLSAAAKGQQEGKPDGDQGR